ncbi:transmembrane protein 109 [Corvus hawaiiensis]|uniref:transmembrane protein 109 n=1 Tax=Corvus hawaiiensis TaxID=134902 RepID=UPI002019DEBC|nr:transmembrane protein 109 [Corvus hawaiiensis]
MTLQAASCWYRAWDSSWRVVCSCCRSVKLCSITASCREAPESAGERREPSPAPRPPGTHPLVLQGFQDGRDAGGRGGFGADRVRDWKKGGHIIHGLHIPLDPRAPTPCLYPSLSQPPQRNRGPPFINDPAPPPYRGRSLSALTGADERHGAGQAVAALRLRPRCPSEAVSGSPFRSGVPVPVPVGACGPPRAAPERSRGRRRRNRKRSRHPPRSPRRRERRLPACTARRRPPPGVAMVTAFPACTAAAPGTTAPGVPRGGAEIAGPRMGSAVGHQALLALLLWIPFLMASAGDGGKDGQEGVRGHAATSDDLLLRLGRSAWDTLENWVGPQPLRMVAESLSAVLWIVSSGISAALSTLCGILGDLLAAFSINGHQLVRTAALAPGEVQRVLLWAVAALVGSWVLSQLRGLLLPLLRGVKVFLFLAAFLHVATSQESPTAQAGMLLGLWVLYALLGSLVASPDPSSRLDAAVRSLEWKVEELRRRQKFGGPRNRED